VGPRADAGRLPVGSRRRVRQGAALQGVSVDARRARGAARARRRTRRACRFSPAERQRRARVLARRQAPVRRDGPRPPSPATSARTCERRQGSPRISGTGKDDLVQPMQKVRAGQERKPSPIAACSTSPRRSTCRWRARPAQRVVHGRRPSRARLRRLALPPHGRLRHHLQRRVSGRRRERREEARREAASRRVRRWWGRRPRRPGRPGRRAADRSSGRRTAATRSSSRTSTGTCSTPTTDPSAA
jgi:hypothetical protein